MLDDAYSYRRFPSEVKKPKRTFPQELTAPPWRLLVLIYTWLYFIFTRKIRVRNRGGKTHWVEATARVYYWISRTGSSASQGVPLHGEPHPTSAESGPCAPAGRVRLSDGERMILATIGAFQRTIAAGAHSLPGTPGWAAQILSSQRGMSIMTERGVPTYAPQRHAVMLEQAIVVATAGLHTPRNSCVQGCPYECVED
jgi:hypothetical protein